MQTSYSKLSDDTWGVFVRDLHQPTDNLSGQTVTVVAKTSGLASEVRLGAITDRRSYGTQYRIARDPAKAWTQQDPMPKVPEGHYALRDVDGTVDFFHVEIGKSGRWDGFAFLSQESGENHRPIKDRDHKRAILEAIAIDPLAACKLYGHTIGRCGMA